MAKQGTKVFANRDKVTSSFVIGFGIFLLAIFIVLLVLPIIYKTKIIINSIIWGLLIVLDLAYMGFAIWDKRRPDVLITLDSTNQSIDIYYQSEWVTIRLAEINKVTNSPLFTRGRFLHIIGLS